MRVGRFATQFGCSMIGGLVLMGASPSRALAQDHDMHMQAPAQQQQTAEQKKQTGALVRAVRSCCRVLAGSRPAATSPSSRLASPRAISGVHGDPCLPTVSLRNGAARPVPAG